jgi:hypothetical protein
LKWIVPHIINTTETNEREWKEEQFEALGVYIVNDLMKSNSAGSAQNRFH